MRRGAAVLAFLAALWVGAAIAAQPAQPPADLGPRGQQVFKMVGSFLAELQDNLAGGGGEINHGPVKIEESAAQVIAILPNLSITPGKNEPAVEVGTIKLTVTEAGPNRDRVEFALPDRVKFPEGGTMRVGQMRKSEMIWARDLETAVGYDIDWREVALVDADNDVPLQVGAVRARMSLREGKPGRYSGPFNLTLSNLTATDDEQDTAIKLGAFTVATEMVDWDIKRSKALMAGRAGDPAAVMAVVQELPRLIGRVASTVSVSGLTVASIEQETSFTIDQADLTFAFDDIDQPAAKLSLRYRHAGLTLDGMDEVPEGFTPRRVNLALAIEKLPLAKLVELAGPALASPPGPGGPPAGASPDAALETLAAAGTGLRLESLAIDMEKAEAAADGVLTVKHGAAFTVAGGFDIKLRGLDAVIKQLKEDAEGEPDPTIGFLDAVRKTGNPSAGGFLAYRLEVTMDGRVLLNGTDMMPLVGAMSGDTPPKAPAPEPRQKGPRK